MSLGSTVSFFFLIIYSSQAEGSLCDCTVLLLFVKEGHVLYFSLRLIIFNRHRLLFRIGKYLKLEATYFVTFKKTKQKKTALWKLLV